MFSLWISIAQDLLNGMNKGRLKNIAFVRALWLILVIISFLSAAGCKEKSTSPMKNDPSIRENKGKSTKMDSIQKPQLIGDLVLHDKAAVGFYEHPIPEEVLGRILRAVTPHASLSEWKLIVVKKKDNRTKLLEAMQRAFRNLSYDRLAQIMDRWKTAPLLFIFCAPQTTNTFGEVPSDLVRPQSLVELGMGVQSLSLLARAYRIETHWIAGALIVNRQIRDELGIPEDYDVAFFGTAGYPSEEIEQKFPPLHEICYTESWGGKR